MKSAATPTSPSREHGKPDPQNTRHQRLPLPQPRVTPSTSDTSAQNQHHQDQLHNRIGSMGQRFLRHFDYTFLLDRSLHQFDTGKDIHNGASQLSPAAEAYLRHYYSQQHQNLQQGKEQQAGLLGISPVLKRRTTVDGSGRRIGTAGLPPLLPLESLSPELLQGRGGASSSLTDLGLEDVVVDAERLARSFVVVEGDDDGGEEHGSRLIQQCSDPSILHLHSREDTGKETVPSTTTAATTSNTSRGWSAFSLPISYRPTAGTTTTDNARDTTFAATTAATATTTIATLINRESVDEETKEPWVSEQGEHSPRRQQPQQNDHVATMPFASTGNNDRTQGARDNPLQHYSSFKELSLPNTTSITTTDRTITYNNNNNYNNSNTDNNTNNSRSNSNNSDEDGSFFLSSNNGTSLPGPRQEPLSSMYHHYNHPQQQHQQARRSIPSFVPPTDTHNQEQPTSDNNSTARQAPRMQRFTRLEDLADLEDLTVRLPATIIAANNHSSTSNTSRLTPVNSHNSRPSGEHLHEHGHEHAEHNSEHSIRREQDERTRQYIEAHTTFLNSADAEGSGYIPPRSTTTTGAFPLHQQQHRPHYHDHLEDHSHTSAVASASRTPLHYPSSLAEEEGYTAPGTPHSFLSSPSLGYYSHPSRPPSQTGYWLDQGASSLNLIMPSSAMFVKSRESTIEGEQLGFVKLMVAGQSRVWNSRLIQDMFRWEGVIANDFDDEFLQEQDPMPDSDTSGIATAGANDTAASAIVDGQSGSGGVSSNESSSFLEEAAGHHQQQRKREYYQQQGQGVREAVVEHYASSMILPAWARAGFDEQELHQEILVKNICIVDTPGYSAFNNPNRAMDLVISYLGLQFQTTNEFFSRSALSDDSLGRFLANNTTGAHSHVDGCLYVIEGTLSEIDIQFMQRLQPLVNLIPVLIPSPQDVTMDLGLGASAGAERVASARLELIRQLKEHEIHIYGIDFDSARTAGISTSSNSSPFTTAVSPEADLASPPLLVLDGSNSLSPEFTTPPFIFHVPPSLVEDTGVGQLDRDVLQLDVITKQDPNHQGDGNDGHNDDEHSSPLPAVTQHRPSSAPGVQEDLPDLGPLRRWVYVNHLAALRHHTTQKFLSWRRHLPQMSTQSLMESSQDSGSYRQHLQQQQRRFLHHNIHGQVGQQGPGQGQQSFNTFSSDSGPGSLRPALSTATHSPPPSISITQHHTSQGQQYYQRALPTDLLGDLRAQDQRRISDKVVRMLETHGQVFERILQERQVAWKQALEGMEREQRIEFLMQELKRWANEGPASVAMAHQQQQGKGLEGNSVAGQGQQQRRKLDVQYRVREGSRDSEWNTGTGTGTVGVTMGLGLEAAMGIVDPLPSLRDALSEPYISEVSNSVRSINAINSRKKKGKHSGRDRGVKKSRSSKVSPLPSYSQRGKDSEMVDDQAVEEEDQDDPLGLGLWMSRLFGAIGRGLMQVVVMVGMGSFATWLYTHFLEHRVTWIG